MVEKRVNGIRSEIPMLRRRLRAKRRSKKYQQYERKVHDSNVYEVRQTLKNYERLVEKRLEIFKKPDEDWCGGAEVGKGRRNQRC